ncbi:MAG: metal ABC transporter permease [Oscillatoriales cyanobacterium]|nr:MAG: metal ABC transporter permease [Oscillatoriales cyanobacterium]
MDWLLTPLQYEFVRHAIAIGAIIGIICPIVGSYLIVLRMSLLGDVIAHAVMPGLAIANALRIDLSIGAFCSGMCSTFVIAWIRQQSRVRVDAAMTLTFSTFFGLGIALISLLKTQLDLEGFLFGDILNVTSDDLIHTVVVGSVLAIAIKLHYKELLFYTFDPLGAEAAGLPVQLLHYGLMASVTLAIITSMKVVGVILAIAMLVGPAVTASLLVKELHQMMAVGAGLGVLSAIGGLYFSFYGNLPSGAAIALVIFSLFLLALLFSPSQGILTRQRLAQREKS